MRPGHPATLSRSRLRHDTALSSREAGGTFASDIERFFRREGFTTFAFQGEWGDVAQHIAKGRPLIVSLGKARHYVVVTGVDWARDTVLTNDAAERKLLPQQRSRFESEWKAADNWTLLAVPVQQASSR